jgi:hypothetical protein
MLDRWEKRLRRECRKDGKPSYNELHHIADEIARARVDLDIEETRK